MALQMDTIRMAFDPTPSRETHPWLPSTPVAEALGSGSTVG
jgi:hypothetical protein